MNIIDFLEWCMSDIRHMLFLWLIWFGVHGWIRAFKKGGKE